MITYNFKEVIDRNSEAFALTKQTLLVGYTRSKDFNIMYKVTVRELISSIYLSSHFPLSHLEVLPHNQYQFVLSIV